MAVPQTGLWYAMGIRMKKEDKKSIIANLNRIYKDERKAADIWDQIAERFQRYGGSDEKEKWQIEKEEWLTEKDVMLITYGDTLQMKERTGINALHDFLVKYVGDAISCVHLLPMYPYTSDDGFSVVDYKTINPDLGSWGDINHLAKDYKLMFDGVINHISKSSDWFRKFLAGEESYKDFFIVADPAADYSQVVRPRALPLLTPFETKEGRKYVWTTFSEDQVDLNFKNAKVLIEILDVLITYAIHGAKFIRLDAIGFLWKEDKTKCIHLPETHEVVKLIRKILDIYAPGTIIITETNVPHKENISYFGNGGDESHLVYQFPLPPLVMFTLLKENALKLTKWAKSLETLYPHTAYFNFLSSHDGIGVRPAEGILTEEERQFLVDNTLKNGGEVSYKDNGDGTKSPYELNINYQDALAGAEVCDELRIKRFLAAETILLSLKGMPGIYIHSLLGSRNDYYGKTTSGIPRRINREKLNAEILEEALNNDTNRKVIFNGFLRILNIRKCHSAFSPVASQEILELDPGVFGLIRSNKETNEIIYVLINVSNDKITLELENLEGTDLLSDTKVKSVICLNPLQSMWIQFGHKL